MTTLYRPVLIESAEQAEALPNGTVVVGYPHHDPDETTLAAEVKDHDWWSGEYPNYESNDSELVGWTALVPIEAEEEYAAMGTDNGEHWIAHVGLDGINGSREDADKYVKRFGGFVASRTRTPWEEA